MPDTHIPTMLTIAEASKRTNLSYDFIRKLCLRREIVFVRCGAKYLINMDKLIDFLNGKGKCNEC